MSRYEELKKKFEQREKIHGTTMIMLNDPLLLEKMIHPKLDFILMDAEHGRFDFQNVIPMLHTLRMLGTPGFVRVQDSQYHLISKMIDMGADGVMIPRTETLEQLRQVIDGVCFGPVGRKGAGGYAQFRAGERFEEFQEGRFVLIQIESQAGIDRLPDMLRVYGQHISAVIIGPNDLSVMLGHPFDVRHEEVQSAIRRVFQISGDFGKSCGIFCNDGPDAQHYRDMGANVLWTASDLQFYMRGFSETMDELNRIS